MTHAPARALRVLLVDDSPAVRKILVDVLTRVGRMSVRVASDPLVALTMMKQARPDVILLDLEMPRMDGLAFLRKIRAEDPIPVVICSEGGGPGAALALQAMDEGAIDVVIRPRPGLHDEPLEDWTALHLTEVVRAAAATHVGPGPRLTPRAPEPDPRREAPLTSPESARLVAVGASIGGIQALRVLLRAMPPASPGFVIVQHLPAGLSTALATRLDATCLIDVKEARDGDPVSPGCALLAPADRHVIVRGGPGRYTVGLVAEPRVSRHRPSVDVLFRSVAETVRERAVGVILSGMGEDGAAGLLEMRRAGAATLAQDESTSAAFGMPRSAIERGAVEEVLPLPHLAAAILRRASIPLPGERS